MAAATFLGQRNLEKNGVFTNTGKFFYGPQGRTFGYGTTTPTDQGWAPGCVFVDTVAGTVYRNSGTVTSATWSSIIGASTTLDNAFDNGKVINGATSEANAFGVGGATDNFTFWQEGANDIRIGTSAGANITIVPNGGTVNVTGILDVSGAINAAAANAFQVNGTTGAVTAVGVDYGTGSLVGTGNIAISTNKFTVAGATGNTVIAGTLDVTGTITGPMAISSIPNNLSITPTATTGDGVTIEGATVTTGNVLRINYDNSLTSGYAIYVYDSTAAAVHFTVGDNGATVITGSAIGTDALTLTAGDLSVNNGNVNIVTTTASAADLLDITRGNSATGGNAIDIAMGSAAVAGNAVAVAWSGAGTGDALSINMTNNVAGGALVVTGAGARSDALIDITDTPNNGGPTIDLNVTGGHATGHAIDIDEAGTSTNSAFDWACSGAYAGKVINILMNNAAITSQAFVLTSNVAATSSPVAIVDTGFVGATGVGLVNISATGNLAHANASCLLIAYSGTGAASGLGTSIRVTDTGATSTSHAVYISAATGGAFMVAGAGTVDTITITSAAAAASAIKATCSAATGTVFEAISAASATTSAMTFANSGTGATGWLGANNVGMLHIVGDGNLAHANASMLYIAYSGTGAATGLGTSLRIVDTGATSTSYAAYISASTGGVLSVVGTGTVTTAEISSGATSAYGLKISTTAATGINLGLKSAASSTFTSLDVSSLGTGATGWLGATGVGMVTITNSGNLAHANASCLLIAYSGTGAATGLGTSLRVTDTGATATSYAVYISAGTGEALFVDTGKAKFTESATFKASNRQYLAPNYVTAGGGPNDITATLTDADGTNVTLAAGLELFVNMGATTLQAGANNMNLNAGGNVAIKKSTAPTVDKAVISAANSIVHLIYNGTSWLDMSE